MPKHHHISSLINLEGGICTDIFCDKTDTINIFLDIDQIEICKYCFHAVGTVVDCYKKTIRDCDLFGRKCVVNFNHKRFECLRCRKTFMQEVEFLSEYGHYTNRFVDLLYCLCRETTIKFVSNHFCLEWNDVQRIYSGEVNKRQASRRGEEVKAIGIDELSWHKGRKSYIVIISDLSNRCIYEVLEKRNRTCLNSFFDNLPVDIKNNIEIVVMDLWGPYRSVVEEKLPKSKILADRFHIQQNLNKCLNNCRIVEKRKINQNDKSFWAHSKYALLKHESDLTEEEVLSLERIFSKSKKLLECYRLKEEFVKIFDENVDSSLARIKLYKWILKIPFNESANNYVTFVKTTLRWEKQFLNYFEANVPKGFVEGANTKIRVLTRKSYGLSSFENLRLRILDSF